VNADTPTPVPVQHPTAEAVVPPVIGISEIAATLAALKRAAENPTLPHGLQSLLYEARNNLQAAIAASAAEHSRYRALFDAVPDPVSVIAWDGTVLDLNKAGIAAYRRPSEEIIGQPIQVLNPDLPRDHMGPDWDALSR
jgi:PAS domain-containing protein